MNLMNLIPRPLNSHGRRNLVQRILFVNVSHYIYLPAKFIFPILAETLNSYKPVNKA